MRTEDAYEQVDSLLQSLIRDGRLDLAYTLKARSEREGRPDEALPLLSANFTGPDVSMLLARNAELLLAFEHFATQVLRLAPDQHDLVHFDAGGFKTAREQRLQHAAKEAVRIVRVSRRPFRFPAMTSRERRLLHLALAGEGLLTRSEGIGAERHLVLHPPSDERTTE